MEVSVVWVDSQRAKLFHVSEDRMERENVEAVWTDRPHGREEAISGEEGCLFRALAKRLIRTRRILLVGPGTTKLLHFLRRSFPEVAARIVGCETMDQPTDPQIAALALKYVIRSPGSRVS